MRKTSVAITLYVVLLFAMFALVSLLVVMSRGNSYFVGKKLKLGAAIISLTGLVMTGSPCTTSCYDPVAPDLDMFDVVEPDAATWRGPVELDNATDDNALAVDPESSNVITGGINDGQNGEFSYSIKSPSGVMVVQAELIPNDGVFDEPYEPFRLELPASLEPGTNELRFYDVAVGSQAYTVAIAKFRLIVLDNNE